MTLSKRLNTLGNKTLALAFVTSLAGLPPEHTGPAQSILLNLRTQATRAFENMEIPEPTSGTVEGMDYDASTSTVWPDDLDDFDLRSTDASDPIDGTTDTDMHTEDWETESVTTSSTGTSTEDCETESVTTSSTGTDYLEEAFEIVEEDVEEVMEIPMPCEELPEIDSEMDKEECEPEKIALLDCPCGSTVSSGNTGIVQGYPGDFDLKMKGNDSFDSETDNGALFSEIELCNPTQPSHPFMGKPEKWEPAKIGTLEDSHHLEYPMPIDSFHGPYIVVEHEFASKPVIKDMGEILNHSR